MPCEETLSSTSAGLFRGKTPQGEVKTLGGHIPDVEPARVETPLLPKEVECVSGYGVEGGMGRGWRRFSAKRTKRRGGMFRNWTCMSGSEFGFPACFVWRFVYVLPCVLLSTTLGAGSV